MPAVETLPPPKESRVRRVGKRKQQGDSGPEASRSAGRPTIGKQVNVRLPDELLQNLEYIGEALGLDLSNVIRMMLTEQQHVYLTRAREAKQKLGEAKPEGKQEGTDPR